MKTSDTPSTVMPFAAPHRAWFLLGLTTALLSMLWWLVYWAVLLYRPALFTAPALPPVVAHGLLMSYGTFGAFIFGFLSTVFPRWQGQGELPSSWRVGVIASALGTLLLLLGLYLGRGLVLAGLALLLLGHLVSTLLLLRVWIQAGSSRIVHAGVCLLGLFSGLAGLAAALAGTALDHSGALLFAVHASIWLYLLPIYMAVTHRMIPFFSRGAVKGAMDRRPVPALALMVLGSAGHMVLWGLGASGWQWIPDLAVVAGSGWLALRWEPWRCLRPPLLAALHIGFLWLPVSLLLSALQSLGVLLLGELWLPRAPIHALTIGFFGTLMVAMVSRVTLGHSGRGLVMDRMTWALVWVMQLVVVLRLSAELPSVGHHATVLAAGLWCALLVLWGNRYGRMLLRPRVDGRPG